jgi:predicted kinase
VRLLRLYGAHRALVRAKVAALESEGAAKDNEAASDARERHVHDHRAYIECARELLTPGKPVLVLMSGLSGSGKTWLAERIARRIGAIHVRSDVERKRMAGLAATAVSRSGVDQGLYAQETNDSTYRTLARCASHILAGDFVAIVDATFQRRADRALFCRLAADLKVPLMLIRCRAPAQTLRARILERSRQGRDASEANLAVLERQQATFEAIDPGEGLDVIDADTTRATVVDEIEQVLTPRS